MGSSDSSGDGYSSDSKSEVSETVPKRVNKDSKRKPPPRSRKEESLQSPVLRSPAGSRSRLEYRSAIVKMTLPLPLFLSLPQLVPRQSKRQRNTTLQRRHGRRLRLALGNNSARSFRWLQAPRWVQAPQRARTRSKRRPTFWRG